MVGVTLLVGVVVGSGVGVLVGVSVLVGVVVGSGVTLLVGVFVGVSVGVVVIVGVLVGVAPGTPTCITIELAFAPEPQLQVYVPGVAPKADNVVELNVVVPLTNEPDV